MQSGSSSAEMNWMTCLKLGGDGKLNRIVREVDGRKLPKALTVLRDWRLNDQPILKMGRKGTEKTQMRTELLV